MQKISKIVVIILIALMVFGSGFLLRDVIQPPNSFLVKIVSGSTPTPQECNPQEVAVYFTVLNQLMINFDDLDNIAGATSRINLTDPILKMQEIKQQFQQTTGPKCTNTASYYFVTYMNKDIDAFLAFSTQAPDAEVTKQLKDAQDFRDLTVSEITNVQRCMPNCKN